MLKKLLFLMVLALGVAGLLYNYHPDFKAKADKFISSWRQPAHEQPVDSTITVVPQKIEKNLKQSTKNEPSNPTTVKASKILHPPDKYSTLDAYARTTPRASEEDIATLAAYLVKLAQNDMDKTRLLFTWVATHIKYVAEGFNTGKYGDCTAAGVLASRKSVCEGYSALFNDLGTAMSLQTEKVIGYAKGWAFVQGTHFTKTNHAWNVVKIDGSWKLFDVTWGSGYAESNGKGGIRSVSKFEPYYFDVAPKEFIFSHLPEDKKWQLMGNAITLAQYEKTSYLRPDIFMLGFNGNAIFNAAFINNTKDFVEAYTTAFPLNALRMPFGKYLQRGQRYSLSIQSSYADQISLIDGYDWNKFTKEGELFSLNYTPQNDIVKIVVKFHPSDVKFTTA